jgi:hypothetical protein
MNKNLASKQMKDQKKPLAEDVQIISQNKEEES